MSDITTILSANEEFSRSWTLPYAARLGSSVRSKGLYLQVRARLPIATRKSLTVKAGELTLRMPHVAAGEFERASAVISKALEGIEQPKVIPRELEDILGISTTERHRWLKDGRLPSAGTRTVKLRGRVKKITFHVFEPEFVEDVLNRDLVVEWREQDAEAKAENRRRAAWKARQKRHEKASGTDTASHPGATVDEEGRPNLVGWEEFERTGLLR